MVFVCWLDLVGVRILFGFFFFLVSSVLLVVVVVIVAIAVVETES